MAGFSDIGMLRALLRDERPVRSTLALHEANRFDLRTLRDLREHVLDLLDTVDLIANDDQFWEGLISNTHVSEQSIDALAELDVYGFAALLEAVGYTAPPPPTADELVDQAVEAVARAIHNAQFVPVAGQVDLARFKLRTLSMRARHDVHSSVNQEDPRRLRTAARATSRAARAMIAPAIGSATGALVESALPGSGVGIVVGRATAKSVGTALAQRAAGMVAGSDDIGTISPGSDGLDDLTHVDPIRTHLGAVAATLQQLMTVEGMRGAVADEQRVDALASLRRRLQRLTWLIEDARPGDLAVKINALGDVADLVWSLDGVSAREFDRSLPALHAAIEQLLAHSRS